MKKVLSTLAISSVLMASAAQAHVEIDNDCDINIKGNISYSAQVLTITTESGDELVFTPEHDLFINGDNIELDNDQQRWVTDYYNSINDAVPMTVSIATQGIGIAKDALTEVFGEMLGHDDDLVIEFDELFSDLSSSVHQQFYAADGSFQFTFTEDESGPWMDATWEREFEDRVDSLVAKSTGRILMAVGSQMMFGDGDLEDFSERMEHFGDDLEQRMESRADKLEAESEALCAVLAKADYAENRMQKNISGLEELNILEITDNQQKM